MKNEFDVIIVGGSYAGLSASMALGRALRRILVVDSGMPCNRQTPSSHNFITHDGEKPAEIARKAKEQVMRYEDVVFLHDTVISAQRDNGVFTIETAGGHRFHASRLLFTSGVKDVMPAIEGFAECWGISVLHCPYCHGYEVRNQATGIIAEGGDGFEMSRLINHWTENLMLFTNGPSQLTSDQVHKLESHNVSIVETPITRIEHDNGHVKNLVLKDGRTIALKAIYARPGVEQHSDIPVRLGCEVTEQGLLKVDELQRTSVPGVYAAGDSTTPMRSVAMAVASGGFAGASINRDLIEEKF